jgi:hypothetical protein
MGEQIVEFVTISIPVSLASVKVPDGTVDEKQNAIYAAAQKARPELEYDLRKYGIITDCSDESLVE